MLFKGDNAVDHTHLQVVLCHLAHTTPMVASAAQEATTRFRRTSPNLTTLIIQTDLDD